jgi:hypothetical protein
MKAAIPESSLKWNNLTRVKRWKTKSGYLEDPSTRSSGLIEQAKATA